MKKKMWDISVDWLMVIAYRNTAMCNKRKELVG